MNILRAGDVLTRTMSSTTVYAAFDSGDMTDVERFKNSFHGAFHVWGVLAKKYLHTDIAFMFSSEAKMQQVWDLADDPRLTAAERIAHVSTFDRAYVRRENMCAVADALEAFTPTTDNLRGQAAAIRKAWEDGATVIGWRQTSVSENLWWVNADDRPFNVKTDELTGPEVKP